MTISFVCFDGGLLIPPRTSKWLEDGVTILHSFLSWIERSSSSCFIRNAWLEDEVELFLAMIGNDSSRGGFMYFLILEWLMDHQWWYVGDNDVLSKRYYCWYPVMLLEPVLANYCLSELIGRWQVGYRTSVIRTEQAIGQSLWIPRCGRLDQVLFSLHTVVNCYIYNEEERCKTRSGKYTKQKNCRSARGEGSVPSLTTSIAICRP